MSIKNTQIKLNERILQNSNIGRVEALFNNFTLTDLAALFGHASTGNLGRLIDLYKNLKADESRIRSGINNRFLSSYSCKFNINLPDETNREATGAGEFLRNNLHNLNMYDLIESIFRGFLYGYNIIEKTYEKQIEGDFRGKLELVNFYNVDHHRVTMNMIDIGTFKYGKLYLTDKRSGFKDILIDELPDYKIIKSVMSEEPAYYDFNSILRPAAKWSIVKTFVIANGLFTLEKYGVPIPVIKVDRNEYDKNSEIIADFVTSFLSNRFGIIYDDIDVEFKEINQNQIKDVIDFYINLCDKEITLSLIGSNLTTDVKSGSFAAAQTHKTELDEIRETDLIWLTNIFNKYVVRPLIEINYPNLKSSLRPTVEFYIEQPADRDKRSGEVQKILKVHPLSKNWIANYLDIPNDSDPNEEYIGGYQQNTVGGFDFS